MEIEARAILVADCVHFPKRGEFEVRRVRVEEPVVRLWFRTEVEGDNDRAADASVPAGKLVFVRRPGDLFARGEG
jgi:hypothetical protein